MHDFEKKLLDSWSPRKWEEVTILLAVSGGGDSIALLRALYAIRESLPSDPVGQIPAGRIVVAHFNHQLRGAESKRDAQFVTALCKTLEIPCLVGSAGAETLPLQEASVSNQGKGLEALAREARYAFLEKAAAEAGARYLVTAHTYDDQVETVLHRILRGTGLRGLGGIARARRLNDSLTLIRPMLELRREEVLRYLDDLDQPLREDASNTDRTFTRNRLRHDLLPALRREYNPAVDEAIARLARLAQENQAFLDQTLDRLIDASVKRTDADQIVLDREALRDEPLPLVRELMIRLWSDQGWPQQAMGYEQWDRLASLVKGDLPPDKPFNLQVAFPGGITAETRAQTVMIRCRRSSGREQ